MIKRTILTMGIFVLFSFILAGCGAEATQEATIAPTEIDTTIPPTAEPTIEITEEPIVEPTAELTTLVAPNPTVVASGNTPEEAVIAANVAVADITEGERLFNGALNPTCSECHIEDTSVRVQGPALTNFRNEAGTRIEGQDAYTYAYNAIRYANDFILDGYEADVMRVYDGVLDDQEVYELIAYIWTLGDE